MSTNATSRRQHDGVGRAPSRSDQLHLPQAILGEAVLEAMVIALDEELVDAAVAQAFAHMTEIAVETTDRRPILEGEIAEVRP